MSPPNWTRKLFSNKPSTKTFGEISVDSKRLLLTRLSGGRPLKPEPEIRVPGRIRKLERSAYERSEYESVRLLRPPPEKVQMRPGPRKEEPPVNIISLPEKFRTRPRKEEEPVPISSPEKSRARPRKEKRPLTIIKSLPQQQPTIKERPCRCGGRIIQKNNRCDRVTCASCRRDFCWRCLAPWGPIRLKGNFHHSLSCKNHPLSLLLKGFMFVIALRCLGICGAWVLLLLVPMFLYF